MGTLFDLADALFLRLLWAAAQATVLIGALWLLGRCMPRMSPAIRCMLWWLVAAQLVLGMTVSTPVELRWLPPSQHVTHVVTHTVVPTTVTGVTNTPATMLVSTNEDSTTTPAIASAWSAPRVIVALWLLGVLLQLALTARQWRNSRAPVLDSQPLRDATLQLLCAEQAHALGLRHVPHLRTSAAIASPQVTGWWRPLVLLPAQQRLSTEELGMALAHELAHLRRGDLWLGWVPAIAQRLFFFHPLVHWAMREYAVYREAACDAQVVQRQHAAPQSYGHLLLRLGVAHPPHAGLAGASSTFENLKRRLMLLQQSVNDATPRTHGWLLVAVIALVGILPYRVTATNATATDAAAQTTAETIPPPPPAPPAVPAAPAKPALPTPPAPPAPPAPIPHAFRFANQVDIDTRPDAPRGIALFDGDTVMVDGNDNDLAEAERLQHANGPVLWFRRGDKAYVVHDAELVRQAREAYRRIGELAQQQGQLAGRQGQLAGEQSGIAARQGALAGRAAEVASRRASIEAQRASAQAGQQAAEQQASINGQLAGIAAETAEIDRESKELDHQAAALSRRAEELSRQQATMSASQRAASQHAEQALDHVLDNALAKGLAAPASR